MPATIDQLTAYLAEAEAAYHALMTGQSAVQVRDQNGETVTFVAANKSDLMAYIQSLRSQLGMPRTSQTMRPLRFIF